MNVVLLKANSAEPDEMQHDAALHPGLHCLPKHLFRGFQYTKGLEWQIIQEVPKSDGLTNIDTF